MKAYTKLTVLMCCQIVKRKSIAPSSGDFGGDRRRGTPVDKIRNFEEKKFYLNNYYPASAAGHPQVCNLNEFSVATRFFCLAGLAGRSTIENLTPIF